MTAAHSIEAITFDQEFISLQVDGMEIRIPLNKISKNLETANEIQRNLFTTSPSGYGIRWPLIDEDLSVDQLLKVA